MGLGQLLIERTEANRLDGKTVGGIVGIEALNAVGRAVGPGREGPGREMIV